MSSAIGLRAAKETQIEKPQERIKHLKALLTSDDPKCRYDYYSSSREFYKRVMDYESFASTTKTESQHKVTTNKKGGKNEKQRS